MARMMVACVAAVVAAFLFAGTVYWLFSINQTPVAQTSPPPATTTGQGNR